MIIRRATPEDSPFIANFMMIAMEEIVYKLIGEADRAQAKDFLLRFIEGEHNQYSYQNCFVAEDRNMVVGAVNVYDGNRLEELRRPILEHIKERFKRDYTPEDETQPGEFYIDTLGVDPQRQGRGLGTQMLQFLIETYVNQRGETLGLLVEQENRAAAKLYSRMGFKPVGEKIFVGKLMTHLQMSPPLGVIVQRAVLPLPHGL